MSIATQKNYIEYTVAELINGFKAGDRSAFGELVRRFEGAVYATALRKLGDSLAAEELAQEVFIRAMEKIDQLKTPDAFGGWVRTIATRLAINKLVRKAPTTATSPEILEATCEVIDSPLDGMLMQERKMEVRAGLARLKVMDRDTLVAFYVDGRSLAEMSTDFSSPVGTIKRRLHVARKRLAKELETAAV